MAPKGKKAAIKKAATGAAFSIQVDRLLLGYQQLTG